VGDAQGKNQRRWRKKWRITTNAYISYIVKQLISKEKGAARPLLNDEISGAKKPIASQAEEHLPSIPLQLNGSKRKGELTPSSLYNFPMPCFPEQRSRENGSLTGKP
jgi:hypothetical protein